MKPENSKPPKLSTRLRTSFRQHTKLALGISGFVLVVIILCVTLIGGSDSSSKTTAPRQTASNPLAPAHEITVGSNRYVSPCQALPLSYVSNNIEKMDDSGYVTEDSLPASITVTKDNEDQQAQTSCTYNIYGSTINTVSMQAVQNYSTKPYLGDLTFTYSVDDSTQATIDKYKQIADTGSNADAKNFVQTLQSSVDKIKATANSDSDQPTIALDGLITPGVGDGSFTFVVNTVVYTLEMDKTDYDQPLNADQLGQISKAINQVIINAKNTDLNQAPIATKLGSTDQYGTTKILEPCLLLTADIFNKAVGGTENRPVSRITPPFNVNKSFPSSDDSTNHLPTAQCTRGYQSNDDQHSMFQGSLRLAYAQSIKQVTAYLSQYGNSLKLPKQSIQTNADETYYFKDSTNNKDAYLFRVGNYAGYLSLLAGASGDDGSSSVYSAPQDTVKTALNAIVAQIKKQQ